MTRNKLLHISVLYLFAFILLNSCENFANGNLLKDSLEQQIKYEKAPVYKVLITSDHGKISPNGTVDCKETDRKYLIFTADSDYQFIRWQLLDKTTGEEIENQDYIHFDDEYDPNTAFSFDKGTADIDFIISPYCEERPKVTFSIPQNGEKNIVRNRTIRITFSKPMDKDSLINNIHLYEGVQRLIDGDLVYDKTDISENANFVLSNNDYYLTITLKDDALYSPSSNISVNIDRKVCDTTSASFENDYTLQFQTNNYSDILAPKINSFSAGLNNSYDNLITIDQSNDENDIFTKIENGTADSKQLFDLSTNAITINDVVANNKLNFYISADDIIGALENRSEEVSEDDVKNILYRISRYKTNANGKVYVDDSYPVETYYLPYKICDYSTEEMNVDGKSFDELTGSKEKGCVATINLNDLEDGLYRFDISTEDKYGNNGLEEKYWHHHENGYKSVFIAKDTKTLETKTLHWINSACEYDDEYIFHKSVDTNIDGVLCVPYSQTYFGIKTLEIVVDKTSLPLASENLKVRYGATDNYSNSLPEIQIESKTDTTITLKEYNANYVPDGYLFIENLCLGTTPGDVKVQVKLTDRYELKGKQTTASEITAFNDHIPPYFRGGSAGSKNDDGPLAAEFTYDSGNSNENVFPRPGKPGVKSTEFWNPEEIKNGDGVPVRWFYTSAMVGENFAVRLKFDVIENKKNVTIYVKKHSDELLPDYKFNGITVNCGAAPMAKISNISASWEHTFETGTWTVYLQDAGGNTSPAYTFAVVEDTTGPQMITDYGRDLKHLITVPVEQEGQPTFSFEDKHDLSWDRNVGSDTTKPFLDWYENSDHSTTAMWARKCLIVGNAETIRNAKYVVRLSGDSEGTERTIYADAKRNDKEVVGDDENPGVGKPIPGEYWEDSKPSRTSSGISQYYICRVYNKWRSKNSNTDLFMPVFPVGTNVEDRFVIDIAKYYNYSSGSIKYYKNVLTKDKRTYDINYAPTEVYYQKYFDTWQPYEAGSNIEIPIFKDYGDNTSVLDNGYNLYKQPPITLCFKDNCGNLNYIACTRPGDAWYDYSTWAYEFHETN